MFIVFIRLFLRHITFIKLIKIRLNYYITFRNLFSLGKLLESNNQLILHSACKLNKYIIIWSNYLRAWTKQNPGVLNMINIDWGMLLIWNKLKLFVLDDFSWPSALLTLSLKMNTDNFSFYIYTSLKKVNIKFIDYWWKLFI